MVPAGSFPIHKLHRIPHDAINTYSDSYHDMM